MSDETTNEQDEIEETTAEEAVEPTVEAAPTAAEAPTIENEGTDPAAEGSGDEAEPGTVAAEAEPEAGAAEQAAEPVTKRKRLPRTQRPQKTRPKREPSATRKPIVRLDKPASERGRRQERQGTVVSDAMEKTIVVEVDMIKAHPKYKKVVRRSARFHAHDERNEAKLGDVVRIVETRPLSKTKRWRLTEVVEVAK